jgi:putative FmdB family regulatory protein
MIYEYECPCGAKFERVLPVSRYDEPQTCQCGKVANKLISRPALAWAQRECLYDCPITGKVISSYAQHYDNLKRHGCQEYDPEMKKDAARFRKQQDEALEKSVDETVERAIEAMPSRKKELLERELSAGASAEIVRQSVPT